ncbi:MAG TPA: phosphate ABC transporter permease PstA [Bacilli bacterium]
MNADTNLNQNILETTNKEQIRNRRNLDFAVHILFILSIMFGIVALLTLIIDVVLDGLKYFTWHLFTNYPSRKPELSGLKSALVGTTYMLCILVPLSFIVGVGGAIYLEEYAKKNRLTRFIQLNISTLAGVPSIVYGILGLTLFVRGLDFGRSLLAGSLTMTLLVLPIIIVAAQEAIKAVPKNRRDASYALGATKWQTVQKAVLPSAISGILTGMILAVSRAIGETAPLVMIGALTFVAFLPESIFDQFTVLPIQIYSWIGKPQIAFHDLAAAGIMLLLILLITLNLSAVLLRNKYQKRN